MSNNDAASILSAFRDIVAADLLGADSNFRERSVKIIEQAIDSLVASGAVDRSHITAYRADKEFKSDFVHALYGRDMAIELQKRGAIDI